MLADCTQGQVYSGVLRKMKIPFLMAYGCEQTTKAAALNTRYVAWWFVSGHRQHTAILEVYEATKST